MLLRNLQHRTIGRRQPPPARPEPVIARPRYRQGDMAPAQAPATDPALVQDDPHRYGPGYMSRVLDTMDKRPEPAREYDGYLHVSQLIGMCARQKILTVTDDRPPDPGSVTGGHRVMWAVGRAVERHVRDSFIQARDYRGVLGRWHCPCDHTQYEGLYRHDAAPCPQCRRFPQGYRELVLRCDAAHIKGSPDLPFYAEGESGDIAVSEIKSMNPKDFDALEAPLADHVFQAACYRRLLVNMGRLVTPTITCLYVTKLFKWGSPYKEYEVDVTTAQWQGVLDTAWEAARAVAQGVETAGRVLPPRTMCSAPTDPLAKACPCLVTCFGRTS